MWSALLLLNAAVMHLERHDMSNMRKMLNKRNGDSKFHIVALGTHDARYCKLYDSMIAARARPACPSTIWLFLPIAAHTYNVHSGINCMHNDYS